jgi:hypothetical protein
MSEVRPQLLITVVHGTWPRGLFPKFVRFKKWVRGLMRRERLDTPQFWFEEGSPFLARLSTELGDIPHTITPLLWTGKNSVYEREKAAHALAKHLSAEHAEYPQANQLVIAHSHGGNIALRALHHLRQRSASQECEADSANPLVVTLATPFVEVHPADFGRRPLAIRSALVAALLPLPYFLAIALTGTDEGPAMLVFTVFNIIVFSWFGQWWTVGRAPARQNQLDALKNATRLGELMSAQRLLVIRAIDDEASLTLALGTIVNYSTARAIPFVLPLTVVLLFITYLIAFWFLKSDVFRWVKLAFMGWSAAWIIMLLGMLMVARTVHGWELAASPLECQINTQSTPDATGLSKIITLVRRTYVKSLRHGIYDHEDCPKAISDWVRSQL